MDAIKRRAMALFQKSLLRETKRLYGSRLAALGVFGSWASGRANEESDLDILIIADPLPARRLARVREFDGLGRRLDPAQRELARSGIETRLSPVFKTKEEVEAGSPLFLDMTVDLILLYDKDDFFRNFLNAFKSRLDRLGAKRIPCGDLWYWDLKPDYRPGETFHF